MNSQLADIMQRYMAGDNEAVAELYLHTRQRLLLLAYSKCHDRELSRDLVQDIFERMIQLPAEKRASYFSHVGGNIEAYLCVAVKNRCLDARKVQNNREKILHSVRYWFADSTENDARKAFLRDGLAGMMGSLQDREQQIIQMHLNGFSNDEIAASLNITYNTVKNNIYEAKKKLRKLWRLFMG